MKTKNQLLIVAGVASEIGKEYCLEAINRGIECVGTIRNNDVDINSPLFTKVRCDLESEESIHEVFDHLDFSKYENIIYLHTIGEDVFEPRGYPRIQPLKTIPEEIYRLNVNTYKYLLRYCVTRISKSNSLVEQNDSLIQMKSGFIAGVPDKYAPFVIESFCETKYIIRQYARFFTERYPDWFSGLCINITSTITPKAVKTRPFANTTFWLTPQEVAEKSVDELLSVGRGYKEIDIIKEDPGFNPAYYESNNLLYEKWSRETGKK